MSDLYSIPLESNMGRKISRTFLNQELILCILVYCGQGYVLCEIYLSHYNYMYSIPSLLDQLPVSSNTYLLYCLSLYVCYTFDILVLHIYLSSNLLLLECKALKKVNEHSISIIYIYYLNQS